MVSTQNIVQMMNKVVETIKDEKNENTKLLLTDMAKTICELYSHNQNSPQYVSVITSIGKSANKPIHFECTWCGCEWETFFSSCSCEQIDTDESGAPILQARAWCPNCGVGIQTEICQQDVFEED